MCWKVGSLSINFFINGCFGLQFINVFIIRCLKFLFKIGCLYGFWGKK